MPSIWIDLKKIETNCKFKFAIIKKLNFPCLQLEVNNFYTSSFLYNCEFRTCVCVGVCITV